MSYLTLRGQCDIIALKLHVPTEDKTDNSPKYHMKILLAAFNAKVGRRCFQTNNWE